MAKQAVAHKLKCSAYNVLHEQEDHSSPDTKNRSKQSINHAQHRIFQSIHSVQNTNIPTLKYIYIRVFHKVQEGPQLNVLERIDFVVYWSIGPGFEGEFFFNGELFHCIYGWLFMCLSVLDPFFAMCCFCRGLMKTAHYRSGKVHQLCSYSFM